MTKPIPDEYPQVMPYLIVDDANGAIDFYRDVLEANERMRMAGSGGRIGHAELEIGQAVIMLADEHVDMGVRSPRSIGGTPVTLFVYVEDVDAAFERAMQAGAKQMRPLQDRFYGDRTGQFEDPYGHVWTVATHVEDVPEDELRRRAAAEAGGE